MLKENISVRQITGEPRRRWFENRDFDLIIWFDDSEAIIGFELCYHKLTDEHALRWDRESGYQHYRIDDGEGGVRKHKASPVSTGGKPFDRHQIALHFEAAKTGLESHLFLFVYEKILQFPPKKIFQ